jgi:predicted ATPase
LESVSGQTDLTISLAISKRRSDNMLVRFIGAPISGKTTVAAQVFAQLKLSGQPNVEFVVEQARLFIAERKSNGPEGQELPPLTDDDQMAILLKQMKMEEIMEHSVGRDGIVITDSSIFNSFWYMTPSFRDHAFNDPMVYHHLETYKDPHNLLFLCAPLPVMVQSDRNRLHSPKDSRLIHDKIMIMVKNEVLVRHPVMQVAHDVSIPLGGPNSFRVNEVVQKIYEKLTE